MESRCMHDKILYWWGERKYKEVELCDHNPGNVTYLLFAISCKLSIASYYSIRKRSRPLFLQESSLKKERIN